MWTTRRLRNANKCNTLTVAFFEILANYEVSTYVRLPMCAAGGVGRDSGPDQDRRLRSGHRSDARAIAAPGAARLHAGGRIRGGGALPRRPRHPPRALCEGCACRPDTGASGSEWTAVQTAADALGVVVAALRTTAPTIDIVFRVAVPLLGLPAPVAAGGGHRRQALPVLQVAGGRTCPNCLGSSRAWSSAAAPPPSLRRKWRMSRFLGLLATDTVSRLSVQKRSLGPVVGAEAYGIFVASGLDPIFAAPASLGIFLDQGLGPVRRPGVRGGHQHLPRRLRHLEEVPAGAKG